VDPQTPAGSIGTRSRRCDADVIAGPGDQHDGRRRPTFVQAGITYAPSNDIPPIKICRALKNRVRSPGATPCRRVTDAR
jgi:hypothetical protein